MEKVIKSLNQSIEYYGEQETEQRSHIKTLERALDDAKKDLEEAIKAKKSFKNVVEILEIVSKYPDTKKEV